MTRDQIKAKLPAPPTPEQYEHAKQQIIMDHAPKIYPCHYCAWPVEDGYCCTKCGSTNPQGPDL